MNDPRSIADRAGWWTYRRQRLGRAAVGPAEALDSVIGVYSAHPTAPLSLAARTLRFDATGFRGLDGGFEMVRVPAMRSVTFAVPLQNVARVRSATARPLASDLWRLREAGIDDDEFARLRAAVLEAATRPRTARELREDLSSERSLTPVLQMMCLEGVLLAVGPTSLVSNERPYLATGVALGGPLPEADPEASRIWLAGEYLRAFGPARVEDLAWWAGWAPAEAAAALAAIDTVDLGEGLLLRAADRDAFEAVEPPDPDAVDVLPKWDAYSMGYRRDGRSRLVDEAHLARVLDKDHNVLGLVLRGGRAIAAWTMRSTARRVDVEIDLFARRSAALDASLKAAFEQGVAASLERGEVRLARRG